MDKHAISKEDFLIRRILKNEVLMAQIIPVILAGGTGTRLWPMSRELYPKQLLNLTEDISLLQATIKRVTSLPEMLLPLVVVVGEEFVAGL